MITANVEKDTCPVVDMVAVKCASLLVPVPTVHVTAEVRIPY
jgi:hypothetical protein